MYTPNDRSRAVIMNVTKIVTPRDAPIIVPRLFPDSVGSVSSSVGTGIMVGFSTTSVC